MTTPTRITLLLAGALIAGSTAPAEAQLFNWFGTRTTYYAPVAYYPATYTYGYPATYTVGYGGYATCCSPCTTCCSPCTTCCDPCATCPSGTCGVASSGELKPSPAQPTFRDGYDDGGMDEEPEPPAETPGFGPTDSDFPEGDRETFKEPTRIPQRKSAPMPTPGEAGETTVDVKPLDSDHAWSLAPRVARVRARARFGNPVVARTRVDVDDVAPVVAVARIAGK